MSKNYYHHQTIYSNRYGYMQENAEKTSARFVHARVTKVAKNDATILAYFKSM